MHICCKSCCGFAVDFRCVVQRVARQMRYKSKQAGLERRTAAVQFDESTSTPAVYSTLYWTRSSRLSICRVVCHSLPPCLRPTHLSLSPAAAAAACCNVVTLLLCVHFLLPASPSTPRLCYYRVHQKRGHCYPACTFQKYGPRRHQIRTNPRSFILNIAFIGSTFGK